MTPNLSHVAGLQFALDTHIIGDLRARKQVEEIIEQAKSAPAEPVSREAVGWLQRSGLDGGEAILSFYRLKDFEVELGWTELPLYTALPSPDAELVELLEAGRLAIIREIVKWSNAACAGLPVNVRKESELLARIDAKLASWVPKESV